MGVAFVVAIVQVAGAAGKQAVSSSVGAARLTDVASIPVLVDSAEIGYVGSIDPSGGKADWDWGEVQDENGEWVLFEDFGPGCVYNFTQHRGETVEEPVFRFYFNGEKSPRFAARPKDFGNEDNRGTPVVGLQWWFSARRFGDG